MYLINTSRSASHDPQLAAKQILSITPILQGQKGQKAKSQSQIAPHHPQRSNTSNQAPSQNPAANIAAADSSAASSSEAENANMERIDTETKEKFVDAKEQ
jgi:hypothetical protein